MLYDIVDRKSFSAIEFWMTEIQKYTPNKVKLILVGNKCDLESKRAVSFKEG